MNDVENNNRRRSPRQRTRNGVILTERYKYENESKRLIFPSDIKQSITRKRKRRNSHKSDAENPTKSKRRKIRS